MALINGPKKLGAVDPPLKMQGVSDTKNTPLPTSVMLTNLVVLYHTVTEIITKGSTLRPAFLVIQSHWNRHRSIIHLRLPINVP